MINKPIDASPHNCCVNKNDGEFTIRYDLPSNEYVDGYYIETFDLQTNKVISSLNYSALSPINYGQIKVTSSTLGKYVDGGEYGWSSFYWQTPTEAADTYIVSDINTSTNELFLKPLGDYVEKCVPSYSGNITPNPYYIIESGYSIYNKNIYEDTCGHSGDEDTSSRCCKGQLQDYFGFGGFWTASDFHSIIMGIGLGNCVIEVYDTDGKLARRAKILAYDRYAKTNSYYYIVDDIKFLGELNNRLAKVSFSGYAQTCLKLGFVEFYNVNDLDKQTSIGGILRKSNSGNYGLIKNSKFVERDYSLTIYPNVPSGITVGDGIDIWSHEKATFNTTPTYYFRVKSSPTISINDFSQLQAIDNGYVLNDIKCKFGINYGSSYGAMNYFYLYLSVLNPQSYKWEIKERSPMLFNASDTYEFVGLMNGQDYKISAVCTDKDGDEWTAEEVEFTVNIPIITTYDIPSIFNRQTTTIELSLSGLLDTYKDASLEFYKVLKNDMSDALELQYAGGGLAKIGELVSFDKWIDYNIQNDSYYDYYIRVEYTGKETDTDKGIDLFLATTEIHTEFEGTSILGLEKSSDSNLAITSSFNLLYHFEKDMSELTNEMSREYINTLNEYPKELKGYQNYISGNCSGLLGSECNGIYEEPKGIRKAWNKFINDDTIKLYRGLDGETMIISIETSRVKPFYFPNVGLVNEVYITFKEIASTKQLAIFRTEKTGD